MDLIFNASPGVEVHPGTNQGFWTLKIPAGPSGNYRLAQLDDTTSKLRKDFPHHPPVVLQMRARVSYPEIPGTWGFGLWNDPFSLSLGFGGGTRRIPALPNAAWFFFASPPNYISFRNDLPAQGFIAQAFQASAIPAALLAPAALAFPLLLWPRLAQKLRPLFRYLIAEDSFAWEIDLTQWHSYKLTWDKAGVVFMVDQLVFKTQISPKGPLGLVIWIDNQYAAFPPDGHLSYGTLHNSLPAWLEIEALSLKKGSNHEPHH